MIKAVIFDLDGVITDTAEYHYQGWKKLADEENLKFDRKLNEQLRINISACLGEGPENPLFSLFYFNDRSRYSILEF